MRRDGLDYASLRINISYRPLPKPRAREPKQVAARKRGEGRERVCIKKRSQIINTLELSDPLIISTMNALR